MSNRMNIIFYDFEIFKFDWLVCLTDHQTKEETTIINDTEQLHNYYQSHKDYIFIGYNNRQYDDYIFRGLLMGMNSYYISNKLIVEGQKGYRVIKSEDYPLISFDLSTGFHSLKQLEGFMGSMIKESDISFDIDRKLTVEELLETEKYCRHDVNETIKVFGHNKKEFDSHYSLIETFNLSKDNFNRTKAQLSAIISEAVKQPVIMDDEFDIVIPDEIHLDKYSYVKNWYYNPINLTYVRGSNSNKFETMVAGCPHVFAFGGIHGSLNNFTHDVSKDGGILAGFDVGSQYPSVMLLFGYTSTAMMSPERYRELRDTRLELKAKGDKRQQPYKIVLNGNFGAMKDKYNPLYSPKMSNQTCIIGQLVILDLIEKIEPYITLIQSNTDGAFFKVSNHENLNKVKEIASKWEDRTGLLLEWTFFNKIVQKDVNNYIFVDEKGKIKSKGSYVKELSPIDFDLAILNKALVNYFIHNTPIEETISSSNDLIEFQKIVKIQGSYKHAIHNNKPLKEKVNRVFASTDQNDTTIFKLKGEDKLEKMANTADHLFIDNEDITNKKIPPNLDRQWYIDFANKRLNDFLTREESLSKEQKINNLRTLITSILPTHLTFHDFLVANKQEKYTTTSELTLLIKLDTFQQYAQSQKLLTFLDYFNLLFNKKSPKFKTIQEKISDQTILYILEQNSTLTERTYSKLDSESALKQIYNQIPNEDIHFSEKIQLQLEYDKKISYVNPDIPIDHIYVVNPPHEMNNVLICGYSPYNGVAAQLMIPKEVYRILPCQEGDVLKTGEYELRNAKKIVGKDSNGINIIGENPERQKHWLLSYEIIHRN